MSSDKSKEDHLRRWTLKRFLVIFADKAGFVSVGVQFHDLKFYKNGKFG